MILTGQGIRNDKAGFGYYGAPRSKTVDGKTVRYTHEGVDYICTPGQLVCMPCTGRIVRLAYPYSDKSYGGVLIEAKRAMLKVFYVEPYDGIVGRTFKIGDPIGIAQDVSKRYPGQGVTPHVHVQIDRCDPEILFKDLRSEISDLKEKEIQP